MKERRRKGEGARWLTAEYRRDKNGYVLESGQKVLCGHRLLGTKPVAFRGEKGSVRASLVASLEDIPDADAVVPRRLIDELNRRLDEKAAEWLYVRKFAMDTDFQQEAFLNRKAVEEERRVAKVEQQRRERRCTINYAMALYLRNGGKRAEDETIRGYRSMWLSRVAHDIGCTPLTALDEDAFTWFQRQLAAKNESATKFDVEDETWVDEWVETGKLPGRVAGETKKTSPKGAKNIVDLIKAALRWARSKDHFTHASDNIEAILGTELFRPVRKGTTDWDPLMHEEFKSLSAAAESMGLGEYIPFMVLVRHGFRPAEARALRWKDVDQKEKRIYVTGSLRPRGGERLVEGAAKTEAALDWVPMAPDALELLATYGGKGDFVVGTCGANTGKPFMPRDYYTEVWKLVREEAGLDRRFKPYHLKHGMVTELLLDGVSETQIILMTRHTSVQTIKKAYAWINKNCLREHLTGRFKL